MPILKKQLDLYPVDLLTRDDLETEQESRWWAIYTRSQREKDLMRRLKAMRIPFYGPMIEKRFRSPSGRTRRSWLPLFANYVFLYGDVEDRYQAMATNCISRCLEVVDGVQLTEDLRKLQQLLACDVPVTREARLPAGTEVRVKTGPFAGQEGIVVKRRGQRRLLVAVNFLQQGASVELDDFVVEPR